MSEKPLGRPPVSPRTRFLGLVDDPDLLQSMATDRSKRRFHVLYAGVGDKFRMGGRGSRRISVKRAAMLLFGDYPQVQYLSVRTLCGEPKCVNPWHMELYNHGLETPVEQPREDFDE